MNNPDPVAASLEAARAAAAHAAPAQPYIPPVGQVPQAYVPPAGSAGTAITQHQPKGHKLAISTMQSGGGNSLSVDNFLGVEKHGIVVRFANDDPRKATLGQQPLQPLILLFDYSQDIAPKYSIRVNTPGGIKFFHSYDRHMDADGVTLWADRVNHCKKGDPTCKGDYPSVDIAGVLLQPGLTLQGYEVIGAGKRIGFSTSIMNFKEYQALHQQLVAANLIEEFDDNTMEGKVVIRLGHSVKTNRGGINYGSFTFECLGSGEEVVVPTVGAAPAAPAPVAPQPIAAAPYVPPVAATAPYVAPVAAYVAPVAPVAAAPYVPPVAEAAPQGLPHGQAIPSFMANAQPGGVGPSGPVPAGVIPGIGVPAAAAPVAAEGAPRRRSRRASADGQ